VTVSDTWTRPGRTAGASLRKCEAVGLGNVRDTPVTVSDTGTCEPAFVMDGAKPYRSSGGLHRMPPRSWWALKKFSDPAVAIAAEAEISSASVAAATICASRYTFPVPAQPISSSQVRA
jgi:hypothetical protein